MNKNNDRKVNKIKSYPVIYPMGFGIGADVENKIIILDFMDDSDNSEEIIVTGSYAIPIKKAKDLVKGIENVIKDMESENENK